MTDYAVPGDVVRRVSEVLVPWLCADPCGSVMAVTRVDLILMKPESFVDFQAVRVPAADRDDVPFWGPSRRALRGKSARRHPAKLARAAHSRNISLIPKGIDAVWADPEISARLLNDPEYFVRRDGPDYGPIGDKEFDTLCLRCERRMRVRIASAIGQPL